MAAGGRAMLWAVVAAAVTVASGQTTEAAAACGTGTSVAATVFAILLLLALAALGIVMYQYIWKPRHCPSLEKVVLAENGQQEGRFAFNNPYMTEDDDIGSKSTLPCHDILAINEKTGTSRSGDFRTPKKHGFCVLTPTSSQPRGPSADDPTVNEAEQVLVPLKGHDFTGLGFTVQGGMREGIFVNTVSQHGPALESGLVQPGDRVTAVTVSFSHITLEDAMAILSQSSPYNVQLHLQKTGPGGGPKKVTTPTGTGDRRHQSSSDLSEGKSHRSGRPDKSPATGSSTSSDTSTQHERKTVVEARAVDSDPRKETVQHVQRDPSASFADSPSGGYREMAVDVPEHMDSSHQKQDTEASSGPSSTARARHLGVQVLPPLTPAGGAGAGTGGSVTPGSESRDGRRSVALGVPSLRLASRDSTDSGHCVEACLTKVANDQPCSRDLDDETGEPSTPGAEDPDHRRVRMGTSSFNKQERLQKKEMDEQPDKPEPAKRQRDVTVEAQAKADVEPQNKTTESEKGDVSRSPMSPEEESSRHTSRDSVSPERHTSEKKPEDEVEFQKLSSEFRTLIQEDNTEPNEIKPGRDYNRSSAEKEHPRSRKSSSSSSSRSGRSSPVQERPKEMTDIPDEMRLAAGVAQDRRSRVDRPARSALFSSTEVLVEQQKTPTEEKPATVYIDPEEDDQETSDDERPSPVATPMTVTPATRTTETRKEDSDDNDEDLTNQKNDTDEKLSSIQKEVEDVEEDPVNEKLDSDSEVEDSKTKVKGERLSSSSETEEQKISQPVEEEELKKTVRSIDAYQDDPPSSKMKIDKLEAFKEVLSLTPSKSPPEKRAMRDHEDDLVGETIEKSHIDRCPCDGPTPNGTAPRITGEVTGLVEVGEKKSAKTELVVTAATESNPPPAEADERTAPPTSAAVSRARSEAAALPETVRAVRAVRRRDSGGPVAEVLSRDAAASGRLCASTGDLTRSEPPRADSPLGRTVSMHIGVGDQADGDSRVSAAACARDQMDLSRLQEGYGVAQPRHIMSTASSNESLDTGSIQEEPENAEDQPPQQDTNNNGTNHHGPADGEIAAPSAMRIETSEKEITEEIKVNGIDGVEGHVGGREEERSRHSSEEDVNVTVEVRVPPALPRIVQSELKRSSESESSDGREEPTPVDSPTPRPSTADETIITQSETPATVASPIVIESAPEPVTDSSITDEVRIVQSELKRSSESESSDGREEPALGDSPTPRPSTADETIITQYETPAAVAPPIVIELASEPITDSTADDVTIDSTSVAIPSTTASDPVQSTGEGASDTGSVPPDAGAAGETTPVARSRRGPPPTPPPRSPASRQVAPPGSPREPDRFEISALELDSVMISHEEFLRQEAERRAHVCRLAANFKSSREPSPAPE